MPLRLKTAMLFQTMIVLSMMPATVKAQGLIFSLPPDGTQVRYEGTYKQIEERPDSNAGALSLEWDRKLWIKSVGTEMAEYDGQMTACRWIEFKVITGKPSEEGTDPGIIGARIYKVLVPEREVRGELVDAEGIPVILIPIVRGYRRFGEGEIVEVKSGVLQVYPLISLVAHFPQMQADPTEQDPAIKLGPVSATQMSGRSVIESPSTRTTNTTDLWRSKEVPFGLAKWTVKIVREVKDPTEPRTAFQVASSIEVTMEAHEVEADAVTELAIPGGN